MYNLFSTATFCFNITCGSKVNKLFLDTRICQSFDCHISSETMVVSGGGGAAPAAASGAEAKEEKVEEEESHDVSN